ncbi:hypothetical protein [Aeromonas cavernicola]|uniref:Uncharacterized protein n=1 Tax=Aeromonas cavernicola TaxID=1006623 RepID=A0A2H9U5N1_9GAMM|nr:hypothetical protein [Aeromonas cavernicola]PJG59294.1 hypothetical protein CUC53_08310 [Aeromonas cavernicola]
MPCLSLIQLAARLPSASLARLLLALLLICNLTLCINWHGSTQPSPEQQTSALTDAVVPMSMSAEHSSHTSAISAAMADGAQHSVTVPSCHSPQGDALTSTDDGCPMQTGVNVLASPLTWVAVLLMLIILPLLFLPTGMASSRLDLWLRDPFLRSRGTHPPSWPRRHLMLSVLRH